MSRDQLEQSLRDLRSELAALGPQAEQQRARLTQLVDEIDAEIDALQAGGDEQDLMDKLRHQIEIFEVEYPRVTNILNDIMVTLSNLGI